MPSVLTIVAIAIGLAQTPGSSTPLSQKRDVMQSEVAITTWTDGEIRERIGAKVLEHDSEVARGENVTAMVRLLGCQREKGVCRASADVVVYKPDGTVLSEMKNVDLASGHGTVAVKLDAADVTGVYRVVATVRDLNARRFGTTERLFGVK
jgi:hypothetical protein